MGMSITDMLLLSGDGDIAAGRNRDRKAVRTRIGTEMEIIDGMLGNRYPQACLRVGEIAAEQHRLAVRVSKKSKMAVGIEDIICRLAVAKVEGKSLADARRGGELQCSTVAGQHCGLFGRQTRLSVDMRVQALQGLRACEVEDARAAFVPFGGIHSGLLAEIEHER